MFLKNFVLIVVSAFLIKYAYCQGFISPCPDLFQYIALNETDRWYGRVTLTTDVELHDGIWLILVFDKPSIKVLSTFGQKNLKLKETEYLLRTYGIRLKPENPLSVDFSVVYNVKDPVPLFKGFRINTRPSCPVPTLYRPKTTTKAPETVPLELGLTTPREEEFVTSEELPDIDIPSDKTDLVNSILNSFFSTDDMEFLFNSKVNHSYYPGDIAFAPNQDDYTSSLETNQFTPCGTIVKNTEDPEKTARWPWHAILFNFIGPHILYTCGGNLISDSFVLTAAHCVTRPRTRIPINVDILSVFLGKQTLKSFGPEVQVKEVAAIEVHPDYNFNVLYNDIAVVTLATRVKFTDFVRPVCLWHSEKEAERSAETGIAVGYGFDMMKQISVVLRGVPMVSIKQESCWKMGSLFPKVLFERNFCAGFLSDAMDCNGDSGGGLVIPEFEEPFPDPIWYLKGLISIGVALQGQYVCNSSQFVVFTEVTKHVDWINSITKLR